MWVMDKTQCLKWQVKKSDWFTTDPEIKAYNPGFGYKWFQKHMLFEV